MDNQNPNQDPPTNPVSQTPPASQPQPVQPPPPAGKPLIPIKILLAILVILMLIAIGSGTFAMLNSNFTKPSPSPTPAPTSSPTPTISQPTSNIPSDWKTYTDQQNTFSFNYPPDWIINTTTDTISILSPYKARDSQEFHIDISKEVTSQTLQEWLKDKNIGGTCCGGDFTLEETKINNQQFYVVKTKQGEYPAIITRNNGVVYYLTTASGYSDGGVYYFDKNDPILLANLKTFDQILSTFKFTPVSPTGGDQSLTPKACTQEAKLCPDGSSVGRQGPNCEFAPCPE
ncbi:MAG: PsbP-related protein [Patescibacteria group bacterium]